MEGKGQERFRPLASKTFRFSCHKGIACFTECCADLHLVLTPYDILRMKERLGLSAEAFLKQYTLPSTGGDSIFPMVRLKMKEEPGRRCPFVTPQGCTIYEDRPGACRIYPLGRGASIGPSTGEDREFYFVVEESHCLGFREPREWKIEEWIEDQGVNHYNEMNRPWMEIVTSRNPRKTELTEEKLGMFYMTSYNLDRFREFVFQTKFLRVFDMAPRDMERIEAEEAELMKLGMRWLRFALFGEQALTLRKLRAY